MARSSSGKSVARAAATGGGTTYRGQMPVNWYAGLVVIVLVGLASVIFARLDYTRSGASGAQPTVGQTWHAALAFDICGTTEAALPVTPSATGGLTSTGKGVLLIAPKSSSESGSNANLGKFASEYTGMTLTNTSVKYPATTSPLYTNGEKCAAGTPDAGKKGVVRVRTWTLSTSSSNSNETAQIGGLYAKHPAKLALLNRQLIMVGFVPAGTQLPKVPPTTEVALLEAIAGTAPVTTTTAATATTTTTAPVTSTTAAGGTTTTTTTTAAGATTTIPSATTTTTKPKS